MSYMSKMYFSVLKKTNLNFCTSKLFSKNMLPSILQHVFRKKFRGPELEICFLTPPYFCPQAHFSMHSWTLILLFTQIYHIGIHKFYIARKLRTSSVWPMSQNHDLVKFQLTYGQKYKKWKKMHNIFLTCVFLPNEAETQ